MAEARFLGLFADLRLKHEKREDCLQRRSKYRAERCFPALKTNDEALTFARNGIDESLYPCDSSGMTRRKQGGMRFLAWLAVEFLLKAIRRAD